VPTETVNKTGVVPVLGATTSQLLAEKGVIVTLAGALDVSWTIWDRVVTPNCVLNVSCEGLAVRVLCAWAVSKQPRANKKRIPIEESDLPVFDTICSIKEICSSDEGAGPTRSRQLVRHTAN
jgi:hypothetical protein